MKHKMLIAILIGAATVTSQTFGGGHGGNSPEAQIDSGSSGSSPENVPALSQVELQRIEAFLTRDGKRITLDEIRRFYLKDEFDAPVLSNLKSLETWNRAEIPVLRVEKLELRGSLGR